MATTIAREGTTSMYDFEETLERTNVGTKIKHAYHTGGVMAPFNFLQAAAAHERAQPAMARIAALAGAR